MSKELAVAVAALAAAKSGSGGGGTAAQTSYDNATSGLTAANVQGAIDEVHAEANDATSAIGDLANLDTTTKNNLVSAINEVLSDSDAVSSSLSGHISSTNNPHSVTASQVGAATATDLSDHTGARNNPHGVTASQVGAVTTATFNSHKNSTSNPHSVTAEQVGAYTKEYIDQLIQYGTALTNNQDLDNIKELGVYRATTDAIGASLIHAPTTTAGVLFCISSVTNDNTRVTQIWIPIWSTATYKNNIYARQLTYSGWTDWNKIGDTTPTALNAGDDLNNIPDVDCEYVSPSSSISASISNTPFTSAAFRVEVKRINPNRVFQILYPNDNVGKTFYQRQQGASGWNAWYKFEGTEV